MPIDRPKRTFDPDRALRPVVVLAERHARGEGPWHAHRRAQLIHASEGVITVRTSDGLWVVPPQRAVWVLPGTRHQVSSRKGFWLRTLYAEPKAVTLPKQCCVVAVDALVEELLVAASDLGAEYPPRGPEARLIGVILDRLPALEVAPLHLPRPRDERLVKVAEALDREPADDRTLEEHAKRSALTARTAARLFIQETGLTFGEWRAQRRVLAALERLGAGASVTETAFAVGYRDVSSFIAMFKAALGQTPARYFRARPR